MSTPAPPPRPPSNPYAGIDLYPEAAWITLSIFLAIIGIFQWGSVLHSKLVRHRKPQKRADEESTHISSRPRTGWSLARFPLAAVNVFRVVAFRWTLEVGTYDLKVSDIVLSLAYIAYLLFWTFIGDQNLAVTTQNVMVWSSRAGLVAASQFPLVTALGTKNNIVSLVTGISYEKLNFLHRVTARSCFALLFIHAGGKIYALINSGSLNFLIKQTWLRFGIAALTSLTILSIVSLRSIRTRAYEFFFYAHFILVFILLLGAYFHVKVANVSYWIWPSFMFWALDRLMRFARVVFYNHLYFGFGPRARLQDATTEVLSDDFVRIRVRRPLHFQWYPGQTAYLIMPTVSKFPLEAHPFSISSVDSSLFFPYTRGSIKNVEAEESAHWKELVFLINVRGGFTKRLRDAATQNQTVKLFIDGPYGAAPDMTAYDTSVFVAGGSGVTFTLPVFLNVIEAARKKLLRCRRVVFIWVIRDANHVHWISDALFQVHALAPAWLTVSIRIFATRGGTPFGESQPSDPELTPDKEGSDEWMVPPSVRIEYGRPDLNSILRGEVETATGSMSVTVCGSQSLTRSVRRALRFPVSGLGSVLSGGPSVTLHVESFGYA